MGVTVFNIPKEISDIVRYTEYITNISKSELYRKAISYFIDNKMGVTDEVLYMKLTDKPIKEQVYVDSCKEALNIYRMELQDKCDENLFPVSGKGIMQKKNRYRNSTLILQAIINYIYYLYESNKENPNIEKVMNYIEERRLLWKESRF